MAETQTVISSIKASKNSSGNCSVCLKVAVGKGFLEFRSLVSLNLFTSVHRAGVEVRGYSAKSVGPELCKLTRTSVLTGSLF